MCDLFSMLRKQNLARFRLHPRIPPSYSCLVSFLFFSSNLLLQLAVLESCSILALTLAT